MTLVDTIKRDAKSAKWVGVLLIIGGLLALMSPFAAGLSVTLIIGALLIASGITQLFVVFRAGSIGEGLLMALLAVLSVAMGGYMVTQPGLALGVLTLILAAFFVAEGILEIIGALSARPADGWGWLLFGGIVSLLLGLMIWRQFPVSGVWAIGILVGIRLVMTGSALIAIASAAKQVVASTEEAAGTE